jgi:aldehyde dehydrogenase (NAD+)
MVLDPFVGDARLSGGADIVSERSLIMLMYWMLGPSAGGGVDDRLMYRREFFIGGTWAAPAGGDRLSVISPSTEEAVGEVPVAITADIDRAVDAARSAFDDGPWPRMTPAERAAVLAHAATVLRKRQAEIAGVTVDEIGCAISQAPRAQTGMLAPLFDYYAELIRTFEFERVVTVADRTGLVTNEPVGVVAAITPWNAPVTLAAWKTAPALAAGCTVVVKSPPEAPLSTFILAEALAEAGLPEGVVNVIPGDREAGEHLVTHPGTDKVAFTGPTWPGSSRGSWAGPCTCPGRSAARTPGSWYRGHGTRRR